MIFDLKSEKIMNCAQSARIRGLDPNTRSAFNLLILVGNYGTVSLHDGNPGRHLVMNEHRNGKVAVGKKRCDVRQMRPDSLKVCEIMGVIDSNLNRATVSVKPEVVGRLVMWKPHRLIAVFLHVGLVGLF